MLIAESRSNGIIALDDHHIIYSWCHVVLFNIYKYFINFLSLDFTLTMGTHQPLAYKLFVGDRVRVSCYGDRDSVHEGVVLAVNDTFEFISLHSGLFLKLISTTVMPVFRRFRFRKTVPVMPLRRTVALSEKFTRGRVN